MALRAVVYLAVLGETLFLLAAIGQLRPVPIALAVVGCLLPLTRRTSVFFTLRPAKRGEGGRRPDEGRTYRQLGLLAFFVPLALLALHPPLAFDETLYHLPTIRSLAASGHLRYAADIRFPVFPQLHELLCVPVYLLAGDTATHLVSLAELLITAALLLEWGGWLATAFFLGSPLVLYLGTIGYVDVALAMFVAAGFYCIDRDRFGLAGFLLGAACSTKYHGIFFAFAALVYVLVRDRRRALKFAATCAAAALPTTLWITLSTHNPVFPMLEPSLHAPGIGGFNFPWRVLWDVTFARARVGSVPPMTPWLIPAAVIVAAAAVRDRRARAVALVSAGYLVVFAFIPQDARYLVSLLPLAAVAAASALPRKQWLVWLAIAPGILYAGYRLYVMGLPPLTPAAREAELVRRVPEYRAVTRAGTGTVYVCGGEQLKAYAKGTLLGDFFGPWSYRTILDHRSDTASIAEHLRPIRADYYLVAKRVCKPPRATGGMQLVYEDAGAQLWRVPPIQSSRR